MAAQVNANELVDRYVAIWNEPKPELRRKLIDETWAEEGVYYNRLFTAGGRDLIDLVIGTANQEYTAKGLTFRSGSDAFGHHGGIRFTWSLVVAANGEVETLCEDFLILDEHGLIAVDYQFGLRTFPI